MRREVPLIRALNPNAPGPDLFDFAAPQHLAGDGFVLLKILAFNTEPTAPENHKLIQSMQSRATGEIFAHEVLWSSRRRCNGQMSLPLELRVSTLRPRAMGEDGEVVGRRRRRAGLLPEVGYINRLPFWQRLGPDVRVGDGWRMCSLFSE